MVGTEEAIEAQGLRVLCNSEELTVGGSLLGLDEHSKAHPADATSAFPATASTLGRILVHDSYDLADGATGSHLTRIDPLGEPMQFLTVATEHEPIAGGAGDVGAGDADGSGVDSSLPVARRPS